MWMLEHSIANKIWDDQDVPRYNHTVLYIDDDRGEQVYTNIKNYAISKNLISIEPPGLDTFAVGQNTSAFCEYYKGSCKFVAHRVDYMFDQIYFNTRPHKSETEQFLILWQVTPL